MEISRRYSPYQTNDAERLKTGQEKAEETKKEQKDEKSYNKIPVPHDEYLSSEKSGVKPSGLYRLGQDEGGKKKVFFDDLKKSGHADGSEQPKVNPDNPKESSKKCTVNTDKVDREIKKLKEEKQQLQQQISSSAGDEKKTRELKQKLAQVENELSQKDNDTYRRQHASVSEQQ